jgi:hypothetical protein
LKLYETSTARVPVGNRFISAPLRLRGFPPSAAGVPEFKADKADIGTTRNT